VPPIGADGTCQTVEDAREAFLVELESFRLALKKSVMICEAEARQVDEYLKEKKRIGGNDFMRGVVMVRWLTLFVS
jgi:THO complex subunit 7